MDYVIPVLLMIIFIPALIRKVPVYDELSKGAADGLKIIIKILPSMVCIMAASKMLRASGALEFLTNLLRPITDRTGIPSGAVPMMLLRPISGSGALGILADNLNEFGADSREGLLSSIIMGSTETTFYTLAVYFGATRVKNTKKALFASVLADIVGIVTATVIVNCFF